MFLRKSSKLADERCAKIIEDIRSRFGINVYPRTAVSFQFLRWLQEALDLMCEYYGIDGRTLGMNGVGIVIENTVFDGKTLFNKGTVVDGLYTPDTNLIHLTASNPNALVHEFIHAVDQAFRPEGRRGQKSFIDADAGNSIYGGLKGFISFLRECDVPGRDVTDFEKTYDAMRQFGDGYLRMPAEVIARMGEFSFWNDNKEECENNPFLRFSCSPYYLDDDRKAVNRFPFHSVEAIRHFIHHAVWEISGKTPTRWAPDRRTELLTERSAEWYRNAWYGLDDADGKAKEAEDAIRYQRQAIDEDAYMTDEKRKDRERQIRNASRQIFHLKKTRADMAGRLAAEAGDPALDKRLSALYPDESKAEAVITYLRECQTAARLQEQARELTAQTQARETRSGRER